MACEVHTFLPAPGTPVMDAMRQFYACQTRLRSPFASLVFSEQFLTRVIFDVDERLRAATQFRSAHDPQIPWPWRRFLDILVHVAALDPQEHGLFTVDDVQSAVLYRCHELMFSERRVLARLLKTPLLLERGPDRVPVAPTEDGVAADGILLRTEPIVNRSKWESDGVPIFQRVANDGVAMQAHLAAIYEKHPYLRPPDQ